MLDVEAFVELLANRVPATKDPTRPKTATPEKTATRAALPN
jgi:hypothetical protein